MNMQIVPDPPTDARGGFYVSVIDGGRHALALGPFDAHDDAKGRVAAVRRYCNEADPRAAWWSFGTCRVLDEADRRPGKLNAALLDV